MEKTPYQLSEKLLQGENEATRETSIELSTLLEGGSAVKDTLLDPAEAAPELKLDDSPTAEQFYESVKPAGKTPKETTLKKLGAEEGAKLRAAVKTRAPPLKPGSSIQQSLALAMNKNLLKIGVTKGVNISQ